MEAGCVVFAVATFAAVSRGLVAFFGEAFRDGGAAFFFSGEAGFFAGEAFRAGEAGFFALLIFRRLVGLTNSGGSVPAFFAFTAWTFFLSAAMEALARCKACWRASFLDSFGFSSASAIEDAFRFLGGIFPVKQSKM